ncbi:MAG: phage late control D family protein [Clostridia bacterium]|nr:phage late control D family protein [Clostridia bacterium]
MSDGASEGLSHLIGYHNLKVVLSCEIKSIYDLRIVKQVNEHVRAWITGVIPEDKKDSYIEKSKSSDEIEILQEDKSSVSTLFRGIITNMAIRSVRGIHYIEIEALSHTYTLDLKRKSRSFQNKEMKYTHLIEKVVKDYPEANFIDTATGGMNTGRFILQYNETDWEFMKRMASHFNAGLVADISSNKPKFWFGTPQGSKKGKLEDFHFRVTKKLADFKISSSNHNEGITERDFIYYEMETDRLLSIGDSVNFGDKTLFVYQAVTSIKNSILRHDYALTSQKGLSQDRRLNKKAKGASLEGKVIDIKDDHVRVFLNIDKEQKKEEAFWFPYSTFYTTEGNTGWYCMPELNDSVKLYFPTDKEEEGIVASSIRRNKSSTDKILDPDIKYMRTRFGKEMMYTDSQVQITGKDDRIYVKFHEEEGVEIYSDKNVLIEAKHNMLIDAKKVSITVGTEIDVICKSSFIKMDGTTHIRGSKVKIIPVAEAEEPKKEEEETEEKEDTGQSEEAGSKSEETTENTPSKVQTPSLSDESSDNLHKFKEVLLNTDSAKCWGMLEDGTNQGIKHFADYWGKFPDRIPTLAERLRVNPQDFAKTAEGFKNFTNKALEIIKNPKVQVREVGDKLIYFVSGAFNPKKGVAVIKKAGKLQTMMPSDPKSFTKMK